MIRAYESISAADLARLTPQTIKGKMHASAEGAIRQWLVDIAEAFLE